MSEYQQWNCQPQSLDKNTNLEICFASLSTAGGWQDVTLKGFLRKFLFLLFVCFSLPVPPHRALWPGATCLISKSPQKACPFLVEGFWGILTYKGNSLWKKSACKSRKCLFSHLIFIQMRTKYGNLFQLPVLFARWPYLCWASESLQDSGEVPAPLIGASFSSHQVRTVVVFFPWEDKFIFVKFSKTINDRSYTSFLLPVSSIPPLPFFFPSFISF